jgi:hypothetical protein
MEAQRIPYLITLSFSLAGISTSLHSCIPAFLQHLLKPRNRNEGSHDGDLKVIYSHEPPHYTLTKDHVEQKSFMQLYTCTDDGFEV